MGGYFLGYFSNVIASRTLVKIVMMIAGDPYATTLANPEKNKFNKKFANVVADEARECWGSEIVDAGETNLVLLLWRDIQRTDHKGIDYQNRLISLWNFCTSTMLPSLLLFIVFAWRHEALLSAVSAIVFLAATNSRVKLQREFVRNVYRIWYVLRKADHITGQSSDPLPPAAA